MNDAFDLSGEVAAVTGRARARPRFCAIAAAALDVWYRHPRATDAAAPATRPLHELPSLLMTPHIAGWT